LKRSGLGMIDFSFKGIKMSSEEEGEIVVLASFIM